jgi:hypothetical protein
MNRYVKYIDLGVQTLCVLLATITLLNRVIGPVPASEPIDWRVGIFFAQMILGPWQMLSSGISIFSWSPLRRLKIIHFVSALVYLALLGIIFSLDGVSEIPWDNLMMAIPAWILALYYYFLSWCWVIRANTRHKGFLPHLGF